MGRFTRTGAFTDRPKFLEALKGKLAKLQEGALRGTSLAWTEEGGATQGVLTGFGARVVFSVRAADWDLDADLPVFVPQSMVEDKFDREFADLKGL